MKKFLLVTAIILVVLVVLYFVYQAFFIIALNQGQSQPMETLSPAPVSQIFTHPAMGYSFDYPTAWQAQILPIPVGAKQKYEDVSVRTPDYKISEGYPMMEGGAEFWLTIKDTSETDIDKYFENESPLVKQLAQNKTATTVDGQPALRYSYSYEGTMATQTIFIKNGRLYTLRFRYPDNAGQDLYWSDYLAFLDSFRGK